MLTNTLLRVIFLPWLFEYSFINLASVLCALLVGSEEPGVPKNQQGPLVLPDLTACKDKRVTPR